MHYGRWKNHGDPNVVRKIGEASGFWRSGYKMHRRPNHPNANKGGIIYEHVMVMSETLGRPLLENERVHHKNGIRDDNRPENLELWTGNHPSGQRTSDLVEWAKELLEEYEPEALR